MSEASKPGSPSARRHLAPNLVTARLQSRAPQPFSRGRPSLLAKRWPRDTGLAPYLSSHFLVLQSGDVPFGAALLLGAFRGDCQSPACSPLGRVLCAVLGAWRNPSGRIFLPDMIRCTGRSSNFAHPGTAFFPLSKLSGKSHSDSGCFSMVPDSRRIPDRQRRASDVAYREVQPPLQKPVKNALALRPDKIGTLSKEPGYQLSLTVFRSPGIIPKLLRSSQEHDRFVSPLFFQRTRRRLNDSGILVKRNLCKSLRVNKSTVFVNNSWSSLQGRDCQSLGQNPAGE